MPTIITIEKRNSRDRIGLSSTEDALDGCQGGAQRFAVWPCEGGIIETNTNTGQKESDCTKQCEYYYREFQYDK